MGVHFTMAVPWFRRQDYAILRQMLDAPEQLPGSYELWAQTAHRLVTSLRSNHVSTHIVVVTSEDLEDFCELSGLRPTLRACEVIASVELARSMASEYETSRQVH